jgi:5-methylcytosine-specific restriction protein B
LTDNEAIVGVSVAAQSADANFIGLPDTEWAGKPGYRIQLKEFHRLDPPLDRAWFLNDPKIANDLLAITRQPRGRGLFYNVKMDLNQGAYLTLAPPPLVRVLNAAYAEHAGRSLPLIPDALHDFPPPQEPSPKPIDIGGTVERDKKIWMWSPGEQAVYWDEFYETGKMGIGWKELGNLTQYQSFDAIKNALTAANNTTINQALNAHMCFDFVHTINRGDIVFAKRGRQKIVGRGIVTGGYEYDPTRKNYQNIRDIRWTHRGEWSSPTLLPMKALTEWTSYAEAQALEELLGTSEDAIPRRVRLEPSERESYSVEQAVTGLFMPRSQFEELLARWKHKQNLIIQGAPGVGKTFVARRLAYALMGHKDPTRVRTVHFHQSYSYEDFVQGYRPTGQGFSLREGVFLSFCQKAFEDPSETYVLIIDEINRGNLSKILGELMLLIEADKRSPEWAVKLAYAQSADERFYVPHNVFLLGMMNTADRSLAVVDYALRRRFSFATIRPAFHEDVFRAYLESSGLSADLTNRIIQRMTALNNAIANDIASLGPGFCIGHSFFMPPQDTETTENAWYEDVIRGEILPLLEEYWFDQPEKVEIWRAQLLG